MEFKIELKDIEKLSIEKGRIITNKKGKKIEYIVNNDVITEVNPYDESRIAEEKINELLEKNGGVKKINTIMRMVDKCNPNDPTYADQAFNYRQAEDPTIGGKVDVKKVNQLVDLDKNGELDKIVKKYRDEINDRISYDNNYKDSDGKQIDITICDRSIKKLKDEILSSLTKLENDSDNNYEFWDKVNTYKEYVNKKNKLLDDLWNEETDKIE